MTGRWCTAVVAMATGVPDGEKRGPATIKGNDMLETDTAIAEPGIGAPGPGQQTISLGDIRAAVLTNLKVSVKSEVGPVVSDGVMSPGESGTFKVKVRNPGRADRCPDGRRASPPLPARPRDRIVRGAKRAGRPRGERQQRPGTPRRELVPEMYLFPTNSVLEVGDVDTIADLVVIPKFLGEVKILCHADAAPDQAYLFPRESNEDASTKFDSL